MKKLLLMFVLIANTCIAEDYTPTISRTRSIDEVDRSKYNEYKERLKERRDYALETRRQLNAGKVHRYWTAIRVPVNVGVGYLYRPLYHNRFYNSGIAPYYEYEYQGNILPGNIRIYTSR